MHKKILLLILTAVFCITGCDKENRDLVKPFTAENFPQVLKIDDEGDGGLEDEDEFSCKITLNDRKDPAGNELSGTVVPLTEDVTVSFRIADLQGFNSLADYITGVTAFYEIDDCTTSLDQNIHLDAQLNFTTGMGSVRFPKDVKELELVFETDDSFFDDDILNTSDRSLTIALTGVVATGTKAVAVNSAVLFTYNVQDDEGIHGDWEVDHTDSVQFDLFKQLFGLINADIASLQASAVDKIEISFEYAEIKVIVALIETETITECGNGEVVAKEIEIEADLADLSILTSDGDIELEGEIDQSNGSIKEFAYKGSYVINGSSLALTLQGEYDDEETEELVLLLKK